MDKPVVGVKVQGVYVHQDLPKPTQHHFVVFVDDRKRCFQIEIGQYEAWAIARALEGETPPRPFTHDIVPMILGDTRSRLEQVCIHDVHEGTFFATAFLQTGEQVKEIDLRPSDAVAFALRTECPIFVAEDVISRCAPEFPWRTGQLEEP